MFSQVSEKKWCKVARNKNLRNYTTEIPKNPHILSNSGCSTHPYAIYKNGCAKGGINSIPFKAQQKNLSL